MLISNFPQIFVSIMTISRDWVGVMKAECPNAFTKKPPFKPKVAFIDGMPLLMKSNTLSRWGELVQFNFGNPVRRFFNLGAKTVVLGFDVYSLVPMAKAITQANRTKKAVKVDFNEMSELPPCIPVEYNDFMRNRTFKRRVIQLVVETLPDTLKLQAGQELIIDYESCPIRFCLDPASHKIVQSFLVDVPPLGECDVKYCRWFQMYGDGFAHSVDGDFIPIGLMDREAQNRLQRAGTSSLSYQVAIYRMEFGVKDGSGPGDAHAAGQKRDLRGDAVTHTQKRPRSMEYVNIPLLYDSLFLAVHQMSGTSYQSSTSHDGRYMEMLACLIGLTGTDFTRHLPMIGVKKIWDMIADKAVFASFLHAYDPQALSLHAHSACNLLVSRLYAEAYRKHVGFSSDLNIVLEALHKSKLSGRTKSMLPTVGRVDTTVRNINWLLQYWRCNEIRRDETSGEWQYAEACPNPVDDVYGFKMSNRRSCAVQWLDET